MSKDVLIVTQANYDEMLASGINDETLLKPGKYELHRRTKFALKEDLHPSNTKVELQIKLDLDVLDFFRQQSENEETEALQLILNGKLRALMESELKFNELKISLINNKEFIASVAEEVKKAA